MVTQAATHLEFICYLCSLRAKAGRFYVREYPTSASSLQEPAVVWLQHEIGEWELWVGKCMLE